MILETIAQRRDLLDQARTVAMVGASANTTRPSYFVFSYLRTRGRYDVSPINPTIAAIDGVTAYPSLTAYAKEHGAPDIIDVFRNPDAVMPIVDEAIALGAPAIWFQYGVVNPDAIAKADAAGIHVVVDRCIKVESARFDGGLAVSGLNTRLITSRRTSSLRKRP